MDGFGYVSGFLLPLVCWLYELPLRPVFYALILMGSVLLLFIALDFWRFAGRIRNLEAKKAQAPFEAWDYPAHGPEEMLFAEIIEKINPIIRIWSSAKRGKRRRQPSITRFGRTRPKRRWRQSSCFCRRNIRTETRWNSLCFRRSSM